MTFEFVSSLLDAQMKHVEEESNYKLSILKYLWTILSQSPEYQSWISLQTFISPRFIPLQNI